jgi:hypothetical protein
VGCVFCRSFRPDTITWEEFTTNFRSHHIPSGVMKIKKKEFLSLKQGGMSVAEYRDKFTSCLAMQLRRLQKTGKSRSCSWMG